MGRRRPQPTGGETEAWLHIAQLLPSSRLSLPRGDTAGTLSTAANPLSPRGCTHIPRQGLHCRSPTGPGAVVAGAAPAGRDERTGRDHALPGEWQGPGGRPRRLAPFPTDPGSSAASIHPAAAPPEGLTVQGCSRSGGAPGAGMLSQGPAFLPTATTRAPPSTSCALHRGVLAPRKQGSPRQRAASHSMCQTMQSPARPHLSACPGTGVGCSGTAEKRVKDQLGAGGCSHAWLPALGARLRPRPGVMPAAPARARPQQQHGAMASAPQHAGACPHDRLLIEPGYILILFPAKGFS